jgi:hypothetical protein
MKVAMDRSMRTTIATPTPMPAFAPVDKPLFAPPLIPVLAVALNPKLDVSTVIPDVSLPLFVLVIDIRLDCEVPVAVPEVGDEWVAEDVEGSAVVLGVGDDRVAEDVEGSVVALEVGDELTEGEEVPPLIANRGL